MTRHKRFFTDLDRDELLSAVASCRRACTKAMTAAEIAGPVYRGADRLKAEIDLLAETLTGTERTST